jgi:hypothetical protein
MLVPPPSDILTPVRNIVFSRYMQSGAVTDIMRGPFTGLYLYLGYELGF